jgi:hypothetical protein
VQAYRHKET